jgi:hypothetical protein
MSVHTLPVRLSVDQAWDAYQSLAQRAIEQPELQADLPHCTETARAWKRWRDMFLALERQA